MYEAEKARFDYGLLSCLLVQTIRGISSDVLTRLWFFIEPVAKQYEMLTYEMYCWRITRSQICHHSYKDVEFFTRDSDDFGIGNDFSLPDHQAAKRLKVSNDQAWNYRNSKDRRKNQIYQAVFPYITAITWGVWIGFKGKEPVLKEDSFSCSPKVLTRRDMKNVEAVYNPKLRIVCPVVGECLMPAHVSGEFIFSNLRERMQWREPRRIRELIANDALAKADFQRRPVFCLVYRQDETLHLFK